MEKYAQIPVIEKGVVFSDPSYDENVWCQYRKQFTDTNWLMKFETSKEDGFISFQMTLGRPTVLSGVEVSQDREGMNISYPARYNTEQVEIGMDRAKMFCGLKEHWDNFGVSAAISTGTDGYFGDLTVFTCKGEDAPAGFFLIGGIGEIFMDEKALFSHLTGCFNAKEISQERFLNQVDPKSLALRVLAGSEVRHANEFDALQQSSAEKGKDPER